SRVPRSRFEVPGSAVPGSGAGNGPRTIEPRTIEPGTRNSGTRNLDRSVLNTESSRPLRRTLRAQDVRHRVVAFVARVLEHLLAAILLRQFHGERPRTDPRLRIVERDAPIDCRRGQRLEALDHLQVGTPAAIDA